VEKCSYVTGKHLNAKNSILSRNKQIIVAKKIA
jgi:hypothetical protein